MGVVWLARDEELEREVALKFLPDLMIHDRAVIDQLKRETKRCLELTHPHIVRIYDFVHDERSGCISMEYVDGETLAGLRCQKEQKVFEPSELSAWTALRGTRLRAQSGAHHPSRSETGQLDGKSAPRLEGVRLRDRAQHERVGKHADKGAR